MPRCIWVILDHLVVHVPSPGGYRRFDWCSAARHRRCRPVRPPRSRLRCRIRSRRSGHSHPFLAVPSRSTWPRPAAGSSTMVDPDGSAWLASGVGTVRMRRDGGASGIGKVGRCNRRRTVSSWEWESCGPIIAKVGRDPAAQDCDRLGHNANGASTGSISESSPTTLVRKRSMRFRGFR